MLGFAQETQNTWKNLFHVFCVFRLHDASGAMPARGRYLSTVR